MKPFIKPALTILFQVCLFVFTLKAYGQPHALSVSPASGPIGTTVTIKGINFNPDKEKNIIFFGPVKTLVNNHLAEC
jgi:hypothetical protein